MNKFQKTALNTFNKYDISPKDTKSWEIDHMYNSSNFMMSKRNVIIKNNKNIIQYRKKQLKIPLSNS